METIRDKECSCRNCGSEADLIVECESGFFGEEGEAEACEGAECYYRGTEPGFVEEE